MLQPRSHWLAGSCVPQPGGSIRTCRDSQPAVRTERGIHNGSCMSQVRADRRACCRVPYPGRSVVTGRKQPTTIWTEAGAVDPALMTNQRYHVASGRVENPCGAVPAGDSDPLAIGAELAITGAAILCHPKPSDLFAGRDAPDRNHCSDRKDARVPSGLKQTRATGVSCFIG